MSIAFQSSSSQTLAQTWHPMHSGSRMRILERMSPQGSADGTSSMQSTGQKSTQTSHPVQDGLITAINLTRCFFSPQFGMWWALVSLIACSELDLDILTVHARRIRPHGAPAGRAQHLARGDAEFGSVPRTNHRIPFKFPFGQRPAPVVAGVIDGVVPAVELEDGKASTRDIYALRLAGAHIVDLRHFNKRRHGPLSPPIRPSLVLCFRGSTPQGYSM